MTKIVDVLKGPIHSSEWPEWDERDDGFAFPYGEAWVLVCKFIDEDGRVDIDEFHFEAYEDAAYVVEHIFGQIIPYEWEDVE